MTRIAIVGATGHIGTALSHHYAKRSDVELDLYSRRPEATALSLRDFDHISHRNIDELDRCNAHIIVNAVGIGDPASARVAGPEFYRLTMQIEERIEQIVENYPSCLTVFMSSGAAYGKLEQPASTGTLHNLNLNRLAAGDWYGASKLAAELRHRSQPERRILDIRIFGFVSAFLGLTTQYLICDIVNAVRADKPMHTSSANITRDYIGTVELAELIDCANAQDEINMAVDTYSLEPVRKFDLLEAMRPLGLSWQIDDSVAGNAREGYWSTLHNAASLGYEPRRRTVAIVEEVVSHLVRQP